MLQKNKFTRDISRLKRVSPYIYSAAKEFNFTAKTLLKTYELNDTVYSIHWGSTSLWLFAKCKTGGEAALRLCYIPSGIENVIFRNTTSIKVSSSMGKHEISLEIFDKESVFRAVTSFTPSENIFVPFMPRDVYPLNAGNPFKAKGKVYAKQRGPKGGYLYFSIIKPKPCSFLYFQNFTSLNGYFQRTQTSPENSISGDWPELGFTLPASAKNPLKKNRKIIISDIFLTCNKAIPQSETESGKLFLDMLARIYLHLPKPRTAYFDWIETAGRTERSLTNKEVLRRRKKGYFLNAYVASNEKPPESMVQMAVAVPMSEYKEWKADKIKLLDLLLKNSRLFYNSRLKTIVRWLPGEKFPEDNSEEEVLNKMDSWYLYHSLMNYGRIAEKGNKDAERLFLNSVRFGIKVAHKFKYEWPIFYDLKTLRVLKDIPAPGELGEVDVGGLYAKVMIQSYKITKDKKYIKEAEAAVKKMKGLGFGILYQTNSTILSAASLADLYRITDNKQYLDLSILCIANVMLNAWLWECNYGYAADYSTFFGLPPLHDNKYISPYEEAESLAVCYYYLENFKDKLPSGLTLLLSEYIKYLLHRGKFFYPRFLDKKIIAGKPREGKINHALTIPLEDIYDGWQKAGQVGQEVYGAAASFIAVTCAYKNHKKVPFIVYCNYPALSYSFRTDDSGKKGSVTFKISGSSALKCELRILKKRDDLKKFHFSCSADKKSLRLSVTKEKHLKALSPGNKSIKINWEYKS